jgi:DNA-binding transcriptional regulator YhcF (GntR family)
MQDVRLTPFAKLIYSYISSYAGGGNQAFPSVSKICKDLPLSRKTFYKHFKNLEEVGYIKHEKIITIDNKFANNIYEIVYTVKQLPKSNVIQLKKEGL